MSDSIAASLSASPAPARTWNEVLIQHDGHMLQSWQWGEFKHRHGWKPERLSVEGPDGAAYAQVLFRFKGPASVAYIPRGPVIAGNTGAVWPRLRDAIDAAARRNRAIGTIIEPDRSLGLTGTYERAGLILGPSHFQPARTVKVPLADDDTLLKQMHQKTRYNVRLAHRRGVEIEYVQPTDAAIDTFYGLMQDTAQRNDFGIHTRAYYSDFLSLFQDNAVLLFAHADGHIAAVLIAASFGQEAIYMYGASSTKHRAHGAAFLLQFEAMRWARERGCTTYDLWGIPDEDPATTRGDQSSTIARTKGDDRRGLYRFKTGFGGNIVRYPDTLERRHVPVLPWLARKLNVIKD